MLKGVLVIRPCLEGVNLVLIDLQGLLLELVQSLLLHLAVFGCLAQGFSPALGSSLSFLFLDLVKQDQTLLFILLQFKDLIGVEDLAV